MPWASFLLLSAPSEDCSWLLHLLQVRLGAVSSSQLPPERLPKLDPDSPSDMLAHQLQALELMPAWGDVSSGVRELFMGSYFGMGLLMRKQEPLDLRRHP